MNTKEQILFDIEESIKLNKQSFPEKMAFILINSKGSGVITILALSSFLLDELNEKGSESLKKDLKEVRKQYLPNIEF